nr:hypothetical protein [Tanacetum cinerariifolium]
MRSRLRVLPLLALLHKTLLLCLLKLLTALMSQLVLLLVFLLQIDADDLEEMDLKWQMAMLTVRARYQSGERYYAVPPPYTRTFMPPKPDLVFHDAPNVNETVNTAFNVELSPTKPDTELSLRPSTPIIEDWVSDSEDDSEAELPQNALSFVQPTEQVKTPRPFVKPVENSILAANLKTTLPKPKGHGNSRNRKACFQYARMTLPNPQRHVVPTALLTKSKLVPLTAARQVTTVVSPNNVTRPRPAKTVVTKPYSPPRRNINRIPFPKASTFPLKVTAAKAPMVNVVKGVQRNWKKDHSAVERAMCV